MTDQSGTMIAHDPSHGRFLDLAADPALQGEPAPRAVEVPYGIRATAGWCWRLLLIGFTIFVLGRGFIMFEVVTVPLVISLLLVALLRPLHQGLIRTKDRIGLPPGPAALVTILIGIGVIAALITLITQQISSGFGELSDDAAKGLGTLQRELADSPLHLTNAQLNEYVTQIQDAIQKNQGKLVSSALSVTSTALDFFTGLFLVLFSTFFFLSSGASIWHWVVGIFPAGSRERVNGAGTRAWATLTAFVRATVIVALVDGCGVGIIAAIIGVPLAIPLGVLVFLGAFVPVVGALVSGIVAVLVALVAGGLTKALIMLIGVIAVQQVEAHVLQPFLMGRAVAVHPLAVILAIAIGVLVAGIVGALFAVPLVAVINVVSSYLFGRDKHAPAKPAEGEVGPLADEKRSVDPGSADTVRTPAGHTDEPPPADFRSFRRGARDGG